MLIVAVAQPYSKIITYGINANLLYGDVNNFHRKLIHVMALV